MAEQLCTVGDIELCYETFGDASDPALLLVMGLGTQMVAWREEFCERLAARGFHVIRFDNRDIGRSTHLRHVKPPTTVQLVRRDPRAATYTLEDMAADTAGLLDCLGIEAAHVVGVSMGGMIAQTLAGRAPERVLTLTSIMSTTGSRWKGQPAPRVYPFLIAKPPRSVEDAQERAVKLFRIVGSTGFERDEDDLRRLIARSIERGRGDTAGTARQLAAIIASGDRTQALGNITAPTLVIHGTSDKLVRPSGGRATAKAIPGARLEIIEGMGHDLPRALWPRIIDLISEHAGRLAPQPVA
jgi:pimeloyl-ACP methyl ester carboxylesterase